MKAIALLILINIPFSVQAESKYELTKRFLNLNDDFSSAISTMKEDLEENRKSFFEMIEPWDISGEYMPQDIISMREQLHIQLENSNIFRVDMTEFENVIITEMAEALTYEELEQLIDIYQKPIFKKFTSISQHMEKSVMDYMLQWKSENEALVNEFQKKSKEISELEMNYLKSLKDES